MSSLGCQPCKGGLLALVVAQGGLFTLSRKGMMEVTVRAALDIRPNGKRFPRLDLLPCNYCVGELLCLIEVLERERERMFVSLDQFGVNCCIKLLMTVFCS